MAAGGASEEADGNAATHGQTGSAFGEGLRPSEDRMLLQVVGDTCTGAFPSPEECAGLVQAAMDAQRCAASHNTKE